MRLLLEAIKIASKTECETKSRTRGGIEVMTVTALLFPGKETSKMRVTTGSKFKVGAGRHQIATQLAATKCSELHKVANKSLQISVGARWRCDGDRRVRTEPAAAQSVLRAWGNTIKLV
ncbi:hypothetical protein EVAR_37036_1 [Eumeta japonica]|uniref:Uncharacterized protein n=1 Tax=Eumeta variegata TaxID=151549 RepID=A0A4C1WHF0_EUMVA|nr:hypothetical protein EVAR_37036_1 [Eumeta japonica]